jgi:tetratricopeptide (TPR) repeat protein
MSTYHGPSLSFGICWFVLFLLPSFAAISIFPSIFNHRLHLAIIGIIIVLMETGLVKKLKTKKSLFKVGIPILLVMSVAAFIHSLSFRNDFYFWKNVTRTSPHLSMAHAHLGEQYLNRGAIDQAIFEYKKAVDLNPKERGVHNTLGVIYANRNMHKEAEKELKKEILFYPKSVEPVFNLAHLYYIQNKFNVTEELLKKTIQINPGYVKGYETLAIFYLNQKRYPEARYYIEQ